jgi:dihydroorotate dehydrogenase
MTMVRYERKLGSWLARALRCLPPELAHDLALWGMSKNWFKFLPTPELLETSHLRVNLPGIGRLEHPVGLAAGFDKNARAVNAFRSLGCSFIEVGTITPKPQSGNPKPRLFRYPDQLSIINRMGFNSDGQLTVGDRLRKLAWNHEPVPLGINLGKNKDSVDALSDYIAGLESFQSYAKWYVINLSSPNTPGLRNLATPEFLASLKASTPVDTSRMWVKFDPDMSKELFQDNINATLDLGYQGVILTNTHRVVSPEPGGLSGHPLSSLSAKRLEWAYEVHRGLLPMIASGGILTGLDVFERLARGARACQIYSALVYRGPWAIVEILEELTNEMKLRGFQSVEEIIGCYYGDKS